jgi:23S rRNA pseudouridine2604 synthase
MASGVRILGTVTKPCRIRRTGPATFHIILTQGLNRQIRRMCSFFGYKVVRLQRVRIMNIELGNLRVGQWRELTPAEVKGLMREVDSA